MARWNRKLVFLMTLSVFGFIILFIKQLTLTGKKPITPVEHGLLQERISKPPLSNKVVLMHSFPYFYEFKSGSSHFDSCDHPCSLSLDSQLISEADCVVFYSHHSQLRSFPTKPLGAVWVYFAVESPIYSNNGVFGESVWHGKINWTLTYRHDSDLYFGYGLISKLAVPVPRQDLLQVFRKKTKLVAWFVSNCHTQSKREDFTAALKDFITVDVYGKCGNLTCGKDSHTECMSMLSREYFFYLAFENSVCVDYLTEKIFRTMESIDIIPVVRGGANYSALLPKNSFVDASEFPSVKALADFLKWLAGNEAAYLRYLEWKKDWKVTEPMPFPLCEMCRRIHNKQNWANVYDNVDAWWRSGVCKEPNTLVRS